MTLYEKFRYRAEHIGFTAHGQHVEDLIKNIDTTDLNKLASHPNSGYLDWLSALSDEKHTGLSKECTSWIRSWGNGGGDYATESSIMDAIDEANSEAPRVLAEAMFNGVADRTQTPFEASCLVMMLMDECMAELGNQA